MTIRVCSCASCSTCGWEHCGTGAYFGKRPQGSSLGACRQSRMTIPPVSSPSASGTAQSASSFCLVATTNPLGPSSSQHTGHAVGQDAVQSASPKGAALTNRPLPLQVSVRAGGSLATSIQTGASNILAALQVILPEEGGHSSRQCTILLCRSRLPSLCVLDCLYFCVVPFPGPELPLSLPRGRHKHMLTPMQSYMNSMGW